MSMKKTDLVKQLAKKLDGRMKNSGVPGRFAEGAAEVVDRREQRRRDAAAGLVAFACKLPGDLVKRLSEQAASHEGGVNAVVAEALEKSLGQAAGQVADKAIGKAGKKPGEVTEEKAPDDEAPATKPKPGRSA